MLFITCDHFSPPNCPLYHTWLYPCCGVAVEHCPGSCTLMKSQYGAGLNPHLSIRFSWTPSFPNVMQSTFRHPLCPCMLTRGIRSLSLAWQAIILQEILSVCIVQSFGKNEGVWLNTVDPSVIYWAYSHKCFHPCTCHHDYKVVLALP